MNARAVYRPGFTLVEVLMALAISAILMVAVGAAVQASSRGMTANKNFSEATRAAQNAVSTMARAVRTSYECGVDAGAAIGSSTGPKNVLYVIPVDSNGVVQPKVAYVYDDEQKQLLLDTAPLAAPIDATKLSNIRARMGGTTPTVFVLAKGVTAASFDAAYADRRLDKLDPDPLPRAVNVQIKVKLDTGYLDSANPTPNKGNVLELCESVVPRTAYDQ